MNFVDVTNDIAFRKIFGSEDKQIILVSFLNAVLGLEGDARVVHVTILNPYQAPILPNMKATIIDVRAKDARGNTFIVEMQVAEQAGIEKRILYYTTKEYSQQIDGGDKYLKLKPVVFIGIFETALTGNPGYRCHHAIADTQTGERILKDIDFFFIELSKFHLEEHQLQTIIEKWVYFIKNASNLDVIPSNTNDEGLAEAYRYASKQTWTKDELNNYDYAAMREQDERGRVEYAEAKGIAIGEKRGIEIGEDLGARKERRRLAQKFHASGMSPEQIAATMDIAVVEVQDLLQDRD